MTEHNETYDLDHVPNNLQEDLRFCIWDASDRDYYDFYFPPLVFLESFNAPGVALEAGNCTFTMPLDWSALVCDENMSSLEIMPLTSLNNRGFCLPVFNPLGKAFPQALEVNIVDVYADVKWYFPKLKTGTVLVIPLTNGFNPPCSLFVKDRTKISDPIDPARLFE